jgi:protein-S-isoprenylcysteine O-methyltransferase Ste14
MYLTQHLYLLLFWAMFYTIHSVLASLSVKHWIGLFLPYIFKFYRLFYNFIAITSLVGVLIFKVSIPVILLIDTPFWLRVISVTFLVSGIIVMILAFNNYPLTEFIGFKREQEAFSKLSIQGINQWVRHPLYSGILLGIIGFVFWEISLRGVISAFALLIYLVIGIYLEEQKLIAVFGEEYIQYQKRVKKLIPKVW